MKITGALSLSLAIAACSLPWTAAAPAQKVIAVPLQRNVHFRPNAAAAMLKARSRYSVDPSTTDKQKGTLDLIDDGYDIEYYGTVGVGTPPQELKLTFDTGSSTLWFDSTLCSNCGSDKGRFDPDASSTYSATTRSWQISYADGSGAEGVIGYDVVHIGGIAIQHQGIELAKRVTNILNSEPIDGLLGLAFDSLSHNVKTPMTNMIEQNLISRHVFGVYLGKQSTGDGSEIVFGGYNPNHIAGELTSIPVDNSAGYWGVTVDQLKVGDKVLQSSMQAIIDTGTTLVILPPTTAKAVASVYDAVDNGDGTYIIDCHRQHPPLRFAFGTSTFEVPSDSIIYYQENDVCVAGFAAASFDFAVLGDVFLKNNYVVFDQDMPPQVHLAPSKP